jgi:tRNA(fMet)-specific endonuclease VapC
MLLYLLDTNAVSDLMHDYSIVQSRAAACQGTLQTSVIVRGEIEFGLLRLAPGARRSRLEAKAALLFGLIPITPVTVDAALEYARIRQAVQSAGTNLSDNDLWIAATAMATAAILVTRDQDFGRVAGLVVEDWTI